MTTGREAAREFFESWFPPKGRVLPSYIPSGEAPTEPLYKVLAIVIGPHFEAPILVSPDVPSPERADETARPLLYALGHTTWAENFDEPAGGIYLLVERPRKLEMDHVLVSGQAQGRCKALSIAEGEALCEGFTPERVVGVSLPQRPVEGTFPLYKKIDVWGSRKRDFERPLKNLHIAKTVEPPYPERIGSALVDSGFSLVIGNEGTELHFIKRK